MGLFVFVKGALVMMIKAFAPRKTRKYGTSVLAREKYDFSKITRKQVKLPPNYSVLSVAKYFDEDNKSGVDKRDEDVDW